MSLSWKETTLTTSRNQVIGLLINLITIRLTVPPKPHPSKVSAVSVIKISGSSWMVFTYRTKVQLSQTTLKNFFEYHLSHSLHVRLNLAIVSKCVRGTGCAQGTNGIFVPTRRL